MLLSLSEKGVSVSVSAGAVVGRIFTWSVGRSVGLPPTRGSISLSSSSSSFSNRVELS